VIANNNGAPAPPPDLIIDEARISAKSWMQIDLDDLKRQTVSALDEQQAVPLDHQQIRAAQDIRRADHAARRAPRAARIGKQLEGSNISSEMRRVTRLDDEKRQRALARARSVIPENAQKRAPARVIPPRNIIAVGGADLRTPESPFPAEDSLANDNRLRAALLTALLIGMVGGYALTAQSGKERNVIEVVPPLEPGILLSHAGKVSPCPDETRRAPDACTGNPGS
jgi:hypothetical protein